MADRNNQRAQNFDNGWSAAHTQAVQVTGTSKEKALLENIRSLVVAAVHDIYGTTNDIKYIYIVDLILKRVKEALKSIDVSSDLAAMHSEISEIAKNMAADGSRDEKAVADACIKQIKEQLARYAAEQKKEFAKLKDSISEFVETDHEAHVDDKDAESIANAVSERLADDAAKAPQYNAKADIAVISDAVKSLRAVVLDAAQSATTAFAKLQNTIDMGFAKMTSSMSLVSSQLSESIQSQTKQLDTVNKISQSNDALMQEVKSISIPQTGNNLIIEALDAKLQPLLNVAKKISSTTTEMSVAIAKVCLDSLQTKALVRAANDRLDILSTSIDGIYTKIDDLSTAALNSQVSIPSDFPKKTAQEVVRLQNKRKSRLEIKFDNFVANVEQRLAVAAFNSERRTNGIGLMLKSQFKRIGRGLKELNAERGKLIGSIISGISSVVSMLFAPIAFMVQGLFSMVSLIFKPLKWILDLLTSPAFLIALGALFYFVVWPRIKDPLLDWYNETLKPAVGKIVDIFSGDKPFFEKVTDSLKVVWNDVGKPMLNSLLNKLKDFGKDVLWPFLRKNMWPFLKNHWKEILVGLGIFTFLSNPMRILSLALKAPFAILNTIKIAVMVSKALIAGLPLMISALPILIPAAIAAGVLGYFVNEMIKAEEALSQQCDEGFKNTRDAANRANENVMTSIAKIEDLKKDNLALFKKLDIKTTTDLVPEEIKTADGRVTTVEFLQENVQKIGVMEHNDTFEQALKEMAENERELSDWQKSGIYARGFSRINAQFHALLNFANSFAADKLNHIGDDTLLQRHKVFIEMFNRERARVGSLLSKYNLEIGSAWSSGSDDEWRKHFDEVADQVRVWGMTALQYLITNPTKTPGPHLNFSKVVDGKVVTMSAPEREAEIKRYNDELKKLSKKDRKNVQFDIDFAKSISNKIDTMTFEAVNSKKQENVDEILNDKALAYNATIQGFRDRLQSSGVEAMQEMLDSMKLAINDTKEDRQIKDLVMQLANNQVLVNTQTTGRSTLTEDQQVKILATVREKINELMAKGDDLTPEQKRRYQAQLDAIATNKELSSKIDSFIEKQEQKTAEEAKSKEKSGGTTNNVQQINIGSQAPMRDNSLQSVVGPS